MGDGGPDNAPRRFLGVMLSSTFADLEAHRAALIRAVQGQDLYPIAMENDAALPDGDVVEHSLRKVRMGAAYIGVVSRRYGQVPVCPANPDGLSLTQLEFREARGLGRPILIFIMADDHPDTEADVELDAEERAKLAAFREEVKRARADSPVERVYATFRDLAGFATAAVQSVAALRRHLDASVGEVERPARAPADRGGIPTPPQLYAEPPYIGSHSFVGRAAQLGSLDAWASASDPHPVLLFEAIGGTGKSMLTWEWVRHHAPAVRSDWAGTFWYSFYEKGAVMADFCRRALAYTTGRPLREYTKLKQPQLSELLVRRLREQPWLLVLDGLERVLVAYHRPDAAQLADEEAGRTDEIADRDPCSAIRPLDDDLLRDLAAAAPSKILVSSRLLPRVLLNPASQPIPGVQRERLLGLRAADAEAMVRACGVDGDSAVIRDYLQRHCDGHPLVCGIVAGLVVNFLPARGDFDAWAADPDHGGRLDLAELDLVGKRNHILRDALDALPGPGRQLLSLLALLPESADAAALAALNPHLPPEPEEVREPEDMTAIVESVSEEWRDQYHRDLDRYRSYERALDAWRASPERAAAPRKLIATVVDLEHRGLLLYDSQRRRYDLHPVVRAVAAPQSAVDDLERLGQRVVDHFSSRQHDPYTNAQSLDDLRDGLVVVRVLQRMGRSAQALTAFRGGLSHALEYDFEAHHEILALLRPFFDVPWTRTTSKLTGSLAFWVSTAAGNALWGMGQHVLAIEVYSAVLESALRGRWWGFVLAEMSNLGQLLASRNRLARAERIGLLQLELAQVVTRWDYAFNARLMLLEQFAVRGRGDQADDMWRSLTVMGREWPRSIYRLGDAERRNALHLYFRGRLGEDDLRTAERLVREGRNREGIRDLHRLRGDWHAQRGERDAAVESYAEAVRMGRETGVPDSEAETRLALARVRLRQLSEPTQEAERLARSTDPDHLGLAELWSALGDSAQAVRYAVAACRVAWGDGGPYVRRYDLDRATLLLHELGADIPNLPAHDPTADPPLPWEQRVADAIDELRRRQDER